MKKLQPTSKQWRFIVAGAVILLLGMYMVQPARSETESDLAEAINSSETILKKNGCNNPILPLEAIVKNGEDEANRKKLAGEQRLKIDSENSTRPYTLSAYKPTYFQIASYNSIGYSEEYFHETGSSVNFQNNEVQFQISFKSLVFESVYFNLQGYGIPKLNLFVGYTNRSFWQMYNKPFSSPFREYNHEPEVWAQFYPKISWRGITLTGLRFGFSHHSNGQGDPLSRSWNRLYTDFIIETEHLIVSLKPWYRIPENASDDNNRYITDYMGHGELQLAYKIEAPGFGVITTYTADGHSKNVQLQDITLSLMTRNNIESGFSRGAIELGVSFRMGITNNFKFYIQSFSGYGESLIDYDHYVNRISFGLLLNDWL